MKFLGRLYVDANHALHQQASDKRQGMKSWEGGAGAGWAYEDLIVREVIGVVDGGGQLDDAAMVQRGV
jgi:hypothetical protein